MSYIYLQEQGEESLAECFSGIPAFAQSRLSPTAKKSYCSASEMESFLASQFGETSEPLTVGHGEARPTSSQEASRARTSARPGRTTTLTAKRTAFAESAAAFGRKCAESLERFNLALWLSKTPRHCGSADLALSCETLPRWGIMLDGECLEFASLARIISEKGFSSTLPTPTCHNAKEGAYPAEFTRNTPTLAAQIGGKVNPQWNEWRMGWPIGWTDLKPLGTGKFQAWLLSHGESSAETPEP